MGKGGSSSESSSSTQNIDKRWVTGEGSVGLNAENSSVSVQALDGGALAGAFEFAARVDANAGKNLNSVLDLAAQFDANTGRNFDSVLNLASGLYELAVNALGKSATMVSESSKANNEIVATAYDQAKGQGADARILAYGAMAVVAVVAVKTFGK